MTITHDDAKVLFAEPGARWRTTAYGPILCLIILILELATGSAVHWFALLFCGSLIAGFVVLQVIAGRRHVSVELTDSTLRQGTETLPLSAVAAVLPERDEDAWDDEDWESARALGELSGVPRRRTGIGLRLADGGYVQAWAKDHRALRAALGTALGQPADTDPARPADTAPGRPADTALGQPADTAPGSPAGRPADDAAAPDPEPDAPGNEDEPSENGADR
ncbi:hypothetical protein NBRGN_113_00730 [Nocardia brasiliensis NBRC 14402]|uniref:hypothetical protein n=1 Tax=Nocardia brasiliensis TaxID=37326 RepID=UPI0002D924D3|nr:hypothetical protein CEQ30_32880 [Nocardia brasiliensis]GAJ87017.1 hypothetical protein NBRGN_113_00730 [Nocardia brasiliensis NBRC 14402]SUB09922.1 Uncharacterised protein [Nocardia brasiliensis]